jgi:hypothetical protein
MSLRKECSDIKKVIPVIVLFLFLLSGFGESALAQDLLILKSGKEMKVNIIEESADIIKYREFDNPEGPLYSVGKDKVASVKYKKGSKEVPDKNAAAQEKVTQENPTPLESNTLQTLECKKRYILSNGKIQSVRKVKTLMEDYPEALNLYEKGTTLCNVSNGCAGGVIVICFVASEVSNHMKDESKGKTIAIAGLGISGALIISGIVLASSGKHKIQNSVKIYNSAISKPVACKLDFGIMGDGIGLALRF